MSAPGQDFPPAQHGEQPSATPEQGKSKRSASIGQILAALLLVLVVVFIIENSREVRIRLIFPEVTAPLYVAILIAAVLGGLIGALLRYRRKRHHQPNNRQAP